MYTVLAKKCPECSYIEKAKPQITMIPEISKRANECLASHEAELKNQELRKNRESEVDSYLESPLGKICENLASMKTIKNAIAKEEEVGRRSGYVRKDVIYQGHKNLLYLEGKLTENKNDYRKSTGKEFKSTECKDHLVKSEY